MFATGADHLSVKHTAIVCQKKRNNSRLTQASPKNARYAKYDLFLYQAFSN